MVIVGANYTASTSSFPFPSQHNFADRTSGTAPRAFLNYISFDDNWNPILLDNTQTNFVRLSSAPIERGQDVAHERMAATFVVKQPGYVYIYLSNDETTPLEVFFDDFTVTHAKGPVVQSEDYYPFGLTFNSYSRDKSTPNMYQYNGKELQDELGLNWEDYGARMYDITLGRWMVNDPKADKYYQWNPYTYALDNPVRFVDPDGRDPREGNEVIAIDYEKHYVTKLNGNAGSIQDYPLYESATRAVINNIGPLGSTPSSPLEKVDDVGDLFGINRDVANNAHTWQDASKRSEGYEFVEFAKDGSHTQRVVRNLNSFFGVKSGFENVVTAKIERDKDGKVVSGVDYIPTIATDKNGKKIYGVTPLYSSVKGGLQMGTFIQMQPDIKKPKKKDEKKEEKK